MCERKCSLRLGEQVVKCTFLSYSETGKLRGEYLNKKWLIMDKEVAENKILRCANKALVMDAGLYLDKVKCKYFNKTE